MIRVGRCTRGRPTETPRGVQSRKHAGSKEGRGKFENPAVVLQSDDTSEAETVKSPTDMPVESDCRGIDADDFEEESTNQRVDETLGFLGSSDGTMGSTMQSSNGEGSGGGGRESQLLFDDVVSAKRNDEEYTKETRGDRESD